MIPMNALYERIDQVRHSRKDLPSQLRSIAEEMSNSRTRARLLKLADGVQQNVPAAEIVARFPEECWLLTVQSPTATTDALTAMLEQSAYHNSLQIKKLRSIAYPMVLLVLAIATMLVACAMLVPPFDEMYEEFALQLPPQTRALIGLSRFVTGNPLIVVLLVAAFAAGLSGLLWLWIGDGVIKRKLLGTWRNPALIRQSLAKVSMQIAELCDEGVPLGLALCISAESNSDVTLRHCLAELAVQANADPSKLSKTRAAMFLPPNFLFALRPDVTVGQRGDAAARQTPNTTLLRELATNYRDLSIRHRDWTSFILGQLAVIGVGFMIAFLVISLFAPLVSLVTVLSPG
jgi:type II secretory pathway component PulF